VRQNETLLIFITRNPPKSPAILSAKISLESESSSELIDEDVELSPMRKISSESSPAEEKSGICVDVDVVELLKEEIKLSRIMLESVVDVVEVDISPEEEDSSIVGLPGVLIFTSSLPSSVREFHLF
jgi:hypothetical protein